MITIRAKNGLDMNIPGQPDGPASRLMDMERVGLSPASFPHIRPKLLVKVGDKVRQGSILFADKRNPDIGFASPGGGTVESIDYGPRRAINAITIRVDREEAREDRGVLDRHQLAVLSRDALARHLMAGGLWPLIRSLPFRDIADPAFTPPAIIINLDTLDPFHAEPALYLDGSAGAFLFGLDALKRLAPAVYIVACRKEDTLPPEIRGLVTHRVRGRFPADDPGVFLYYTRASAAANRCWYIHGRDVVLLGKFLSSGVYPVKRLVSVSSPNGSRHVLSRLGAPLALLAPEVRNHDTHVTIAGGLWRGQVAGPNDYLGLYDAALTLLPAGNQPEFLGFLRPGRRKPSHWRAFLSALHNDPLALDAGRHGEERACVNCGSCAAVCPVDILPQFTLKSVLAGEIEEALAHGLLDCVECGLCAYVCPSKIELTFLLRQARESYYREQQAVGERP
ncbi:MAG: 4Fe-4S dicluster domain-containing protein [Thermodesulfobacteriota bacterium]